MPDYICFGEFREADCGHPEQYYRERFASLDCRGGLKIAPSAQFGFYVHVWTQSHAIESGKFTVPVVDRPVQIDAHAWIGSDVVLYNCHVEHHAIIACGSVVRNCTVPAHEMWEGNPARPIKRWAGDHWEKIA